MKVLGAISIFLFFYPTHYNLAQQLDNYTIRQDKTRVAQPTIMDFHKPNLARSEKKQVALIIEKRLYDDLEVKRRIERYKNDNQSYSFTDILFEKSNDPIISMNDTGETVKKNSLELRNTIKKLYKEKGLIGIFVIGDIYPTIYRDARQWRDLRTSGFHPSIYPLISFKDEHYNSFSVIHDGFYEKAGQTRGCEIGGGYTASIWGGTLIPPTRDKNESKKLIIDYFDRNHRYRTGDLNYGLGLLYTCLSGCSQRIRSEIINSFFMNAKFLCPNMHPKLDGIDSSYKFSIRGNSRYLCVRSTGQEVLRKEYDEWIKKSLFPNSRPLEKVQDDYCYEFNIVLEGRSIPLNELKKNIEQNLPEKLCQTHSCSVNVIDNGFREKGENETLDYWKDYPSQRQNWTDLYKNELEKGSYLMTFFSGHGYTSGHLFEITSDYIKSNKLNSMIFMLESCSMGNYLIENYIAGNYLFYTNALVVSAYSIPVVDKGREGYYESEEKMRFLNMKKNEPIIESLFLYNYGNYIFLGDPLLKIR